ncbi:MAG: hypothetical protein JSU72_08285 [Deltaproteobacteria bacterium]|nr:MAG: hypothetical protein JSU72_08285 [Deltaproteobacteria bacterium]
MAIPDIKLGPAPPLRKLSSASSGIDLDTIHLENVGDFIHSRALAAWFNEKDFRFIEPAVD